MARSHFFIIAGWMSTLGLAAVACGDSVTGGDIGDANDAGRDSARGDDATVIVPSDANIPDTNRPDVLLTDGGPPTISTATLDFGNVNCGATALPQSFVIQNPGITAVAWSAALGKKETSPFTLSASSGSIAPGDTVTVVVTPAAIGSVASTAANAFGDVVTLSLGKSFGSVSLKQTAHGAILGFSPTAVAFGSTPTTVGAVETPLVITNAGNATAALTLSTTGDPAFAIVGDTMVSASPGSNSGSVSFSPTAIQSYTGELKMTVDPAVPLCGPVPANVPLTGAGTDQVISVTPPSLLFGNSGLVDCGTTATAKKVRVQNTSATSTTFTATLDKGATLFTVTPASGTVNGNGFIDLTLQPKGIPSSTATTPEAFTDTLTVTTLAGGDSPHLVSLHQTARGAILTRSSGSLAFGNVGVGRPATSPISFANTGNVDITVALANGLPEYVQPSPVTISAGAFAAPTVTFSPTNLQSYPDIGTVSMTTTVPLCGALPSTLGLSGTGVAPSLSAAPTSFNFGFVSCGTATPPPTTIKITNNGAATTYNATLQKGALRFTVSPPSAMIPAGGTVNLVVTPQAIPPVSPVSSNFFGDTLDVTSSNGSISVGLTLTAQGAIIDYNARASTQAFPQTTNGTSATPVGVTVRNQGNIDAVVSFVATTTGPTIDGGIPAAFFADSVTPSITAGTTTATNIGFTPPGPGTVANYAGTWAAVVAPGTVTCAQLPTQITLSGSGKP